MKTTVLSFDEYVRYFAPKVRADIRVSSTFEPRIISPLIPLHKVDELTRVEQYTFASLREFNQRMRGMHLVWYKDSDGESCEWDDFGATNLLLRSRDDAIAYRPGSRKKIKHLMKRFSEVGLKKDVKLVSAMDIRLKKEILIDGNHRAVALWRLAREDPSLVDNLIWDSKYKVYLINFQSPAASLFFPCDFLNFCSGVVRFK